jgi:hypothetical protein
MNKIEDTESTNNKLQNAKKIPAKTEPKIFREYTFMLSSKKFFLKKKNFSLYFYNKREAGWIKCDILKLYLLYFCHSAFPLREWFVKPQSFQQKQEQYFTRHLLTHKRYAYLFRIAPAQDHKQRFFRPCPAG